MNTNNRTMAIALLFSFFSSVIGHSKQTDVLLVSLPKSGSNFFVNTLIKSNPKINYKHEYFNKIQTVQMAEYLNINIKRLYTEYFFALELTKEQFATMYRKTWEREPEANFTKEVFSGFRVHLMQDYFTTFALYRHRKYTFPTFSSHLFLPLYQSFETVDFKDPDLATIKKFVINNTTTDQEKECAIHTVTNFLILRECGRHNLPVIDYDKIMELSGKALHNYLEARVPHQLFSPSLATTVELERNDEQFLEKRLEKYNASNLEVYCQKLIRFLKTITPDMPYWFLFDL